MLQAPGPRGSPHDPQALIGRSQLPDDLAGVLDCAAKTDISFCSSAPRTRDTTAMLSRVRYSKRWPQPTAFVFKEA